MTSVNHDEELTVAFSRRARRRWKPETLHAGLPVVVDHQNVEVFAQELLEGESGQGADVFVVIASEKVMHEQAHLGLGRGEELLHRRRYRELGGRLQGRA